MNSLYQLAKQLQWLAKDHAMNDRSSRDLFSIKGTPLSYKTTYGPADDEWLTLRQKQTASMYRAARIIKELADQRPYRED